MSFIEIWTGLCLLGVASLPLYIGPLGRWIDKE